MKTVIIIAVLVVIAVYSFRSIIKHFKGEDECCGGCSSSKNGGECCCGHKKHETKENVE